MSPNSIDMGASIASAGAAAARPGRMPPSDDKLIQA
jgi:hypothetical protein